MGEYLDGSSKSVTLFLGGDFDGLQEGELLDVITVNLTGWGYLPELGHVFVQERYTQHADELERHGLMAEPGRVVTYGPFRQRATERRLNQSRRA